MEIQRIRELRGRLDAGGTLTVQELHYLFTEIEYLHKCREDLIFTNNRLQERVNEECNHRNGVWAVPVS